MSSGHPGEVRPQDDAPRSTQPTILQQYLLNVLKQGSVPQHVGFIMDGNRRFGRKHSIKFNEAHTSGFNALIKVMDFGFRLGIKAITTYAFSIDNYNRPPEQVDALMNLTLECKEHFIAACEPHEACIRLLGEQEMVREDVRRCWEEMAERTKKNTKCVVNVCFAYTSRMEITTAVKSSVQDFLSAKACEDGTSTKLLGPEIITMGALESRIYTSQDPPLDLIVRSSGVQRLSDFMLWQCHQDTPIFVVDCLWPEMTAIRFVKILLEWRWRQKRRAKDDVRAVCEE